MRIVTTSRLLGRALARLAHVVTVDRLVRTIRFTCRLAERLPLLADPSRPAAPAISPPAASTPEEGPCR
jgi:hypothetical protein